MNNPLVSIIIPTYNRAHFIGETLESVIAQTYQNWECIVVDDDSNDYTDELMEFYCEKDTRIKYHHRSSHKPKGANACRNYGFDLSKGDLLIFLDSDDFLEKQCIQLRKNKLIESKLDFVCTDTARLVSDFNNKFPINDTLSKLEHCLYLFASYNFPWWSTLSVMWSRRVIHENRFNEKLARFQDVEIYIRILIQQRYKFDFLNRVDNFYRMPENERIISDSYKKNVVNSLFKLINIYLNCMKKDPKLYISFRIFFYKIAKEFLFKDKSTFSNNLKNLFSLRRKKFLNNIDFLFLSIQFIITYLHLNDVKGILIFRFNNIMKKNFRY
ncbi:Glycosyltransferase involved in cell wall bisynthesis [Zunongwangia mangrovi]|uniref:Glycosyltransferase involved in cell wall bisynthesis n=1 Tax=Zunongwangia mangrovi TaxID=1334022 RepID=A0A1I1LLL3_9FLAO|nr:glycosyltransferase family 2 protein [Zunongwangia mangrovi]SFC74087.1 Glycosyltransferase involved in cell wall bisynthesis [Zunongwangia mangrovi]